MPVTEPPTDANRGQRVLVIDDDPDSRFFARRWLGRAGFDVVEATSGESGLAAAAEQGPDVIVLDVHMPGIDGFEVARRLRADPVTVDIPIIHRSLSAVDHDAMADGYDAGAVAYLIEPVAEPVLVAAVTAAIRTRDQKRRLDLAMSQPGSGVFELNVATGEMEWSSSLEQMMGFEPGRFEGTLDAFLAVVDPADRNNVQQALTVALESGDVIDFDYRARSRSGDLIWVEASGRVFRGASGRAAMVTGVARDVTDSELSRQRSALLLEVATDVAASATVEETLKILDDALSLIGSSASLHKTKRRSELRVTPPESDDPDEAQFVRTLHRLGSTAIDRAMLFERERNAAGLLGQALMPHPSVDTTPFVVDTMYEPASAIERVGGDFFDVLRIGDRVVVAVGDVAGHGIGAARDMAQLRGAVRTLAIDSGGDPARTLDRLAHLATRGVMAEGNTATLLVAAIDPDGSGSLASAGHPPPILVKAAESSMVSVQPRPLLGMTLDVSTPSSALHLAPGEELVFYTDGVVEQRSTPIDASILAFAAALTPGMTADEIIDAGGDSGSRNDDDRVVVVVRR